MTTILQTKQDSVAQLCARYRVARLELFGSAARGGFEPGRNDLDFLVRFQPCMPEEHAERYFGLLADFQDLFGCGIDLVEIGGPEVRRWRGSWDLWDLCDLWDLWDG
jgi:predicted nucleotidyltransferase